MKLSIIIGSYNEIDYISEAIDSCLNQTFDYEIIIIDDGSDDGSIELIKEYARRYPNIIKYHIMDRSDIKDIKDIIIPERVSNNIKKAFTLCNGEYITLLAGDDINTVLDRYQKQVEFLDNNPKYDSCYTDYKWFWSNGKEWRHEIGSYFSNQLFWATKYIHISCFVFKKKCLKNIPERFCDDDGAVYTVLSTGKTKYLKINAFGYRQRERSLVHTQDEFELNVYRISTAQDFLNQGSMKMATLGRFFFYLKYMKVNRKALFMDKYKKYIDSSSKYQNDILKAAINNSFTINKYIIKGYIYSLIYKNLNKVNTFINNHLLKNKKAY